MGATHLPSTEFDGTEMDDQLEAEAEAAPGRARRPQWCSCWAPTARWAPTRFSPSTPSGSMPRNCAGFYADMAAIRRFDQEATALQRQGQLALWVPLTGQEAAQIGSGRASQPQDYIFPTYREHGVALTRNVDLAELLRQFRGVSNGGWNPKDTNFHLYTLVLAAQTPHAVGYAMGIQRDQKLAARRAAGRGWARSAEPKAAVMVYFGDGASSEGDVHESMVFASSYKAPVVFFCQNNHWAISVPSSVQTRIPLANRAKGYGFPGIRVDGNDVDRRPRRHRMGAGAGPRGQRSGADRGLHLPGRGAHHGRRSHQVPRVRRGSPVAGQGSAGAPGEVPPRRGPGGRRLLRRRSGPTATNSPPTSARPPTTSKPRTSGPPSPTRMWRPTRWWPRSWPGSRSTAQGSPARTANAEQQTGRPLMTTMTIAKAINEGLRATLSNNPKHAAHGRGHRAAGRRLPRHRRTDRPSSAPTAWWTPRWPNPASSAPRSAWPCAATCPSARSSSTASCFPASTRSPRSWPRCTRAATAT